MASLAKDVQLYPVGAEALDLIMAIHRHCFSAVTGESWRHQDVLEVLGMPGAMALIAGVGGDPHGYALARIAADECELLSLGVLTAARRQGVGQVLLDAVTARCREAGVARLFLEVREDNAEARAFYRKAGLRDVGIRHDYYRGAQNRLTNAITMAKGIAQH